MTMAPYRRSHLSLVALIIVAIFLWIHYTSFPSRSTTNDEYSPPFPVAENSIFGPLGNKVLPPKHAPGGDGSNEVRAKKANQKPIPDGQTVTLMTESVREKNEKGKQDQEDETWRAGESEFAIQGPDNQANSTLGFGAIVAISTSTSKRRESLRLSGELTGLKITIPAQPKWTDTDVEEFMAKNHSVIMRGSALAWLGHVNALKWFVDQPFDTAMIIEDDVDWDIHLRSHQIPLLSRAFHELVTKQQEDGNFAVPTSYLPSTDPNKNYWPSSDHWDLLYLGHCGDFFHASEMKTFPYTIYHDPNMPSQNGLHLDTQRFMSFLGRKNGTNIPIEQHRILHKSQRVLCSFAYVINKKTARQMLKDMSHEEENHGTIAYDVRILEACRDWNWKCWTVNPELFHHVDGEASEIRQVDGGLASDSKQQGFPDDAGKVAEKPSEESVAKARAKGTPNIGCGIRSLVKTMGGGETVKKIVRLAMVVDGLCPVSMADLDAMKEQIIVPGRSEIEVGE